MNDHKEALTDLLMAIGLTFKNAKRRYTIGDDQPIVLHVAAEYWQNNRELTRRQCDTLACAAFWRLYDNK